MLAETMWCSALLRSVTSLISQRIVPRRPPRSRIQAIVTAAGKADSVAAYQLELPVADDLQHLHAGQHGY